MSVIHERQMAVSTATPKQRVQASIMLTVLAEIAERVLQHDKANPAFRLTDLRDDNERAVFIEAVHDQLFSREAQHERARKLNAQRAHSQALRQKPSEDLAGQARADIAKYGVVKRGNFGLVPAGRCYICTNPIDGAENGAKLELSASLKADVHPACCMKDARFECTPSFNFRVKGGFND